MDHEHREKRFFCLACNTAVVSQVPPEGWFSVRRFTGEAMADGFSQAKHMGLFCSTGCIARRLPYLADDQAGRIAEGVAT